MTSTAPDSPPHAPAPRGRRVPRIAAVAVLLGVAAGGLFGACSDRPAATTPATGPAAGPGSGAAVRKAPAPRNPVVEAALARRPELKNRKIVVLGLDGLDIEQVRRGAGDGRLPNCRRLMDHGAFGPLRTMQPTLSPILWTSIATGRWPTDHGILDFTRADPDDPKKRVPVTSDLRQVEAMWDIAGKYGRSVGLVGWLASHPAEPVNGFAVSERNEHLAYLFNQEIPATAEGKTYPGDLEARVRAIRKPPSSISAEEARRYIDVTDDEWQATFTTDEFTVENRVNNLRLILQAAKNFRNVGVTLWEEQKPNLLCTYFETVDATSHYFQCYEAPAVWKPKDPGEVARFTRTDPKVIARAAEELKAGRKGAAVDILRSAQIIPVKVQDIIEGLSGAEPERVQKWGRAVDGIYEWADALIGEWMARVDAEEDAILVVVSDHGFAFGAQRPPWDSHFNSRPGGASYHRENGVLAFWGKGVKDGHEIEPYMKAVAKQPAKGAHLLDIAPTVLALLGFPKAKDMPGRILEECFTMPIVDPAAPPAAGGVDTYESGRALDLARMRVQVSRLASSGIDPVEAKEREALITDLLAVGYLGESKDAPVRLHRHRAASFLEQGNFEDALDAFREALVAAKGDERLQLLIQTASVLGKLERFEEAEVLCREALQNQPKFLPAIATLAGLLERKKDFPGAVALWRKAREAQPDHPVLPVQLAMALRERALGFEDIEARNADLEEALGLIEIAKTLAPAGSAAVQGAATSADPGATDDGDRLGPGGHNIRGMILLELNRYDEAIAEFEAAAKAHERYIRPRNNLAVVHMRLAMECQGRADHSQSVAEAESYRAEERRNAEIALKWFDDILAIDPDYVKAYCNRGEIRMRFRPIDLEAARRDFGAALEREPGYRRARDLLLEAGGTPPPAPVAPRREGGGPGPGKSR